MKKCNKCLKEKSWDKFYKNRSRKDGFENACKECERNRKRGSKGLKEYMKNYRQTHKAELREGWKKWRKANMPQFRANLRVADAIRRGKLVRGNCEICKLPNAEAHHEDYSKPLMIRWLCKQHHVEVKWNNQQIYG